MTGKIASLDIGNNSISARGAFHVSEYIKRSKSLRWINLYMNDIGDEVMVISHPSMVEVLGWGQRKTMIWLWTRENLIVHLTKIRIGELLLCIVEAIYRDSPVLSCMWYLKYLIHVSCATSLHTAGAITGILKLYNVCYALCLFQGVPGAWILYNRFLCTFEKKILIFFILLSLFSFLILYIM